LLTFRNISYVPLTFRNIVYVPLSFRNIFSLWVFNVDDDDEVGGIMKR